MISKILDFIKIQLLDYQEIIEKSFTFFFFKISGIALMFILSIKTIDWLSVDKWGELTFFLSVINILTIVSIAGFDTLIKKKIATYISIGNKGIIRELLIKSLCVVVALSLLMSTLIYFSSHLFDSILNVNNHLILLLFVGIPGYSIYLFLVSVLNGFQLMKPYSFFRNAAVNGLLLIALSLLVCSHGEQEFLLPIIFVINIYVLDLILILFLVSKKIFARIQESEILKVKKLVVEAFPFLLLSSGSLLLGNIDRLMLGSMLEFENVGSYDVVLRISQLTSIIILAVGAYSIPKFAAYFNSNQPLNLRDVVNKSTKLIFWLSVPIVIFVFLCSAKLLSYFQITSQTSIYALWILNLGQLFNTSCGLVAALLKMTDQENLVKNVLYTILVLNIILNFIFIKIYGEIGAAIGSSICMIFRNTVLCYYAWRRLGLKVYYIPLIKLSST